MIIFKYRKTWRGARSSGLKFAVPDLHLPYQPGNRFHQTILENDTVGLSISINSPSREVMESAMTTAITAMAIALTQKKARLEHPKGPSLEITFMLPGKLDKPGFTGMRMGGYTEQEDTLYFERAVPEDLLHSSRASEFVALVLEDAVHNATDYFADRGRLFNLTGWKAMLSEVDIRQ